MTTGERMKKRRKEIGLSAEVVASKLGVSPATIYRYENGAIDKVPGDILAPIAEILNTTPAYLMGWEDDYEYRAEVIRAISETLSADHASGRDKARDDVLKTHGSEHDAHMTRMVGDKFALLYYHAFDDNYHCTAVSQFVTLLEQVSSNEAARLYTLALAYTKANERTRQMVGLALDQFIPEKERGCLEPLIAYPEPLPVVEDMPDAETIALARQILEDKRAKEASAATNGENGNAGGEKLA